MLRILFFAVILPLGSFASVQSEEGEGHNGKQHHRATLRHLESGGIGYQDGYSTLEVLLCPDPGQWRITPFLDCRYHIFNNGKWAANAGLGFRTSFKNRVYGINTYYDYRKENHFNSNQIGAGFEILGEQFEFRINGYLPVLKKISNPYDTVFKTFSGNSLLLSQKYDTALKGVNAEFGVRFGKCKSLDFYAAAGPYYFNGKMAPAVWGGKARISGTFSDILTLEISSSYDRTFHHKFQAQISLGFSFGHQSRDQEEQDGACKESNALFDRMLQSVNRQEMIVIDNPRIKSVAMDPTTGQPYRFVFVDNTSNSDGTYESPYHSLAQAQENSLPNNIIYVFPGDGTAKGMDSGIILKANQKLWGSGISHVLQTSQGAIAIPAGSSSSPVITNTNVDTEGNAITLAANNSIRGLTITSAINDAIYGVDLQSLEVSFCTFKNTATFPVEAYFPGDGSISLTNNRFLNNVNGIFVEFNGTSTLICSDNAFNDQTSVSSMPLEIEANGNVFAARIENNLFQNNTTGSIRFNLNDVVRADVSVFHNTMTNNGSGFQASLGSSLVVLTNGTVGDCSIALKDNVFSGNAFNSLYMHSSGAFRNLEIAASANTMSGNGGSSLVLATPVEALTLFATDNNISQGNDNAIAVISAGKTSTGSITIKGNIITDIGNASNGIAINQDFSALNLSIVNNEIDRCEGTGIISYAPTGSDSIILNIADNKISNCQNLSANAASGIDIEQYANLEGSITNNALSGNAGVGVFVGSGLSNPAACLTLTGNASGTGYLLSNPVGGLFNLSPCDADTANAGLISRIGEITPVQSCPDGIGCPVP